VTLLPVVERELRVAARKRGTFWTRVIAAILALLIGIGFFILVENGAFGIGTAALGKGLFAVLTWLSLAVALASGLFFTADCLSEEKREGTLGFLFLTDLRGYDVVFGKLIANSLRGFFALFAVLPVLGITLLMGGVTGSLFWNSSVALINALFLSLATGMFISSISRDPQKAMAGTLLLLVLIGAGGPLADAALSPSGAFQPLLSATSPIYLFMMADARWPAEFWSAFAVNQLIAWLLLGLSCLLLPRNWQTKATKLAATQTTWRRRWIYGREERRGDLRRKLIDKNPVSWLASRERWQAVALWAVAFLFGLLFAIFVITSDKPGAPFLSFAWNWLSGVLTLLLYLGVASQAARFFVDAQRSGLTELLLSTPLTVHQIIRGQWRALLRMFGLPLVLCIGLQIAGSAVTQYRTGRQFAAMTVTAATMSTNAPVATNTVAGGNLRRTITKSASPARASHGITAAVVSVLNALTVTANLVTLCWFGMWMGTISKNSSLAALKTILFVQIMPWFVVTFIAMLTTVAVIRQISVSRFGGTGSIMAWYAVFSAAVSTTLYLAKDVVLSLWTRKKLNADFRAQASGVMRHKLPAPATPLPPPLSEPIAGIRA